MLIHVLIFSLLVASGARTPSLPLPSKLSGLSKSARCRFHFQSELQTSEPLIDSEPRSTAENFTRHSFPKALSAREAVRKVVPEAASIEFSPGSDKSNNVFGHYIVLYFFIDLNLYLPAFVERFGSYISDNPAITIACIYVVGAIVVSRTLGNSIVTSSENLKSGMILGSAGYWIWAPSAAHSALKLLFGGLTRRDPAS